ncbi:MAG: hypothetical protein V4615_03025 [Bacteroidota bacterium]
MKTTIITLLLLAATSALVAQEKYEYAILRSTAGFSAVIFTTSDNQEVISTKPKENEKELIKKANELSQQGWEVFNTTDAGSGIDFIKTFYLRKKKQ